MHWLLQQNLSTEAQLVPFVNALDSLARTHGATWSFIKLIPFVGDVEPDDDYTGRPVFALGSTSMVLAAQKRGWKPGVVYNAHFRFEAWVRGFGAQYLLNGDGVVSRFADARVTDKGFIRPCEDLKAFTGFVLGPDELTDWQRRVAEGERTTRSLVLDSDTMVVTAPPKFIYREWRFFVVAGRVITGSQYRDAYGLRPDANVDADVTEFAQRMVDRWQPGECFVLDVGETEAGLFIIEVNCFNGSGAYLCDLTAAFAAVEEFYA